MSEGLRAAIYYRVSTDRQDASVQLPELKAYVEACKFKLIDTLVDDGISATKGEKDRDGLAAVMDLARRRKIDVLVVWAYDRFARSLLDGILYLNELDHLGVNYISLQHKIDTRTPMGRMYYQVINIFAEHERAMTSERTKAKLRKLKDAGVQLGRPMVPEEIKVRIRELAKQGLSVRKIAECVEWVRASGEYGQRKVVNISKSMVSKVLNERPPNSPQIVTSAIDGVGVA